jgi:hypothetical protein
MVPHIIHTLRFEVHAVAGYMYRCSSLSSLICTCSNRKHKPGGACIFTPPPHWWRGGRHGGLRAVYQQATTSPPVVRCPREGEATRDATQRSNHNHGRSRRIWQCKLLQSMVVSSQSCRWSGPAPAAAGLGWSGAATGTRVSLERLVSLFNVRGVVVGRFRS